MPSFSPLLIGERGATQFWLDVAPTVLPDFQSPPHRGTWCDEASSNTFFLMNFLSVPSSSGNVVRRLTKWLLVAAPRALSVPSSSGNVVRLVYQRVLGAMR